MADWISAFTALFLAVMPQTTDCRPEALRDRVVMDPATRGDFPLWDEPEASIDLATDILGSNRSIDLVASWKSAPPPSKERRTVTVYLVESPGGVSGGIVFRNAVRNALQLFKQNEDNIRLSDEADKCQDIDDCVTNRYDGNTTRLAADLVNRIAAADIARADAKCPIIVFQHRDLEAYDQAINIRRDGNHISQRFLLVPILLHEVGHHVTSDLPHRSGWWPTYSSVLSQLNEQQREELRADAYAAVMVSDACNPDKRPYDEQRKESCMAVLVQWFLHYRYMLFDRSRSGLCRMYFPYSKSHPNLLLRLLVQGLIVSQELLQKSDDVFQQGIDQHLKTRDVLLRKPWISTEPGCERSVFVPRQ